MKNKIVIMLVLSVIFSCACSKETSNTNEENVFTYWIGSSTVPCTGVAPIQCMQVKKGADFDALEWTYFYDTIKGFDYKPGYVYKLKVKEEKIPLDQVPADASSIKYTLIKMLDKKLQTGTLLNDIWVLEKMASGTIPNKDGIGRQAQIEINVSKKKFYGNDGCNNMMGAILKVDSENLQFSGVGTTKMACPDMGNSYKFTQALEKTNSYKIDGLKLFFFDVNGKELLQFKKVD